MHGIKSTYKLKEAKLEDNPENIKNYRYHFSLPYVYAVRQLSIRLGSNDKHRIYHKSRSGPRLA